MIQLSGDLAMVIQLAQAIQLMALQILMGDLIRAVAMQRRREQHLQHHGHDLMVMVELRQFLLQPTLRLQHRLAGRH